VKPAKALKFTYGPTIQTRDLPEIFRTMVNHSIHIGLDEGIRGRLRLRGGDKQGVPRATRRRFLLLVLRGNEVVRRGEVHGRRPRVAGDGTRLSAFTDTSFEAD